MIFFITLSISLGLSLGLGITMVVMHNKAKKEIEELEDQNTQLSSEATDYQIEINQLRRKVNMRKKFTTEAKSQVEEQVDINEDIII